MSVSEIETRQRFAYFATVLHHELFETGDATPNIKLSGRVALQASGGNFVLHAERSTIDPASGDANWTVVFSESLHTQKDYSVESSKDVRYGVRYVGPYVAYFDEPAVAWWRVSAALIKEGPVLVSLSGGGA